jgi:hypothetical protein
MDHYIKKVNKDKDEKKGEFDDIYSVMSWMMRTGGQLTFFLSMLII